jgi:3-deoxy-D-manno-octulosonate 8-phosphate phosphatase (KDO 8-P phosphatase)
VTELRDRLLALRLVCFDFDGVFTDNTVYVSDTGHETVRCNRSDGLGLRKLEAVGIKPIIVSTETNEVVVHRARKLKIDCYHGCADKVVVLHQLLRDHGLTLEQVAFVGNDINDEGCLRLVGLPITVADSHPDVLELGAYTTRRRGGYGAVREICDMIALALSSRSVAAT